MAAHESLLPDVASSLALAVVTSSTAPMLLLDGDFIVITASTSFCRAFKIPPLSAPGHKLAELGNGEWDTRELRSLLEATLAGHADIDAFEMDLERKDQKSRRLVLNAQLMTYLDKKNARIVLTAVDITDARTAERQADELLRERDVMLKELQHRVANSLQIIASVLLQSARRVGSDDSRNHLFNAHQRVMSVAAMQQQLAASRLGPVSLRAHLTDLCRSIETSMISDPRKVSIDVDVDDSTVNASVSVSLGLIVAELMINAIKHAFPTHRAGMISVVYGSDGDAWTLSVSDDGVGVSAGAKPSLGTGIIADCRPDGSSRDHYCSESGNQSIDHA